MTNHNRPYGVFQNIQRMNMIWGRCEKAFALEHGTIGVLLCLPILLSSLHLQMHTDGFNIVSLPVDQLVPLQPM